MKSFLRRKQAQAIAALIMAIVVLAMVVGLGLSNGIARAAAPEGPPVGGCPPGYDLVTVQYVLEHTGLTQPDPSMDPNGDGLTCLKLLDTGSGTRATWHDNVIP